MLTLFEGVATGAADGYARMAGRPAATLLHLGPGLGNGLANLHNARRGRTPLVNVVGDHARSHKRLDAPLESDIDARRRHRLGLGAPLAVARPTSPPTPPRRWPRRDRARRHRHADPAGRRVVGGRRRSRPPRCPARAGAAGAAGGGRGRSPRRCARASRRCSSSAGDAVGEEGQLAAGAGRRRHRRAADVARPSPRARPAAPGCPDLPRLPYPPEMAIAALAGTKHLVLAGADGAGALLRLPGRARAPGARGLHRARAQPPRGRTASPRCEALADRSPPGAEPEVLERGAAGAAHRRADPAGDGRRRRGAAAGGRDRRRRGADLRRRASPS